eukprot:5742029-Amphidinium_carterae.1
MQSERESEREGEHLTNYKPVFEECTSTRFNNQYWQSLLPGVPSSRGWGEVVVAPRKSMGTDLPNYWNKPTLFTESSYLGFSLQLHATK